MTVPMSAREWHSIDFGGFFLITAGRLLGTVAGVALLVFVPGGSLSTLVGVLILAAALASFLRPSFEVRDSTRLTGGMASGVVSTVAALGGTPLALVYQDRSGAELRSTLSISFVVGITMSLVGLGLAGKVEGRTSSWPRNCCPDCSSACGPAAGSSSASTSAGCARRCWPSPRSLAW